MIRNLDMKKWVGYFQKNGCDRPEPDWKGPIEIGDTVRPYLVQSLREFQLGDGGGPASLIAWNAARWRKSLPGLEEVVDLWFEEEKEHSRLLGGLLERYGVEPIEGHWSFSLFCWIRRLLGVRFELQVLTLTELSSTAYYRLLKQYGTDSCLREVCGLILRDEAGHLAFQHDRLVAAGAPGGFWSWLWRAQFRLCGWGAASVLWLSHGACLRRMGATTRTFYAEAGMQFSSFLDRIDRTAVTKESIPARAFYDPV
ncbi:MAG: hypothetical protein AAF514_16275 [Verrucomicrobiota bacterium]